MGRPIGVAWLYEQLEETVKRELGLEKQLAAAEAQNAFLRRVAETVSRDGNLVAKHLRTWADSYERELGYEGSNLCVWLRSVADALVAWDAARGQNEVNMTEERYERRSNEPTD